MFEAVTGFFQANALWGVTCIAFIATIIFSVNFVARRSANRWREAEERFKNFEALGSFRAWSSVGEVNRHD